MEETILKVNYLDSYDFEKWGPLQFAKAGDACFDFRIVKDCVLYPNLVELIGTGIRTEFPKRFVLHIFPRSGMACKKLVTLINAPATIDSSYRGEILLGLINLSNDIVKLERGDRVAQGRLADLVPTVIMETDFLSDTERGNGGFGHTGYK